MDTLFLWIASAIGILNTFGMSDEKPIVILWDIDGTLVTVDGAGEKALVMAMRSAFGIDTDLSGIDYSGRTDRRIAELLHTSAGIPLTPESVQHFLEHYIEHLEAEVPPSAMGLLPGVPETMEWIRNTSGVEQGLLTGNLRSGANIKLSKFHIWEYFPFGAFSDFSVERNELGPYALEEAERYLETNLEPGQLIVVGDTPHDVVCGKVFGALTMAVATGKYSMDQLALSNPDFLVESVSPQIMRQAVRHALDRLSVNVD